MLWGWSRGSRIHHSASLRLQFPSSFSPHCPSWAQTPPLGTGLFCPSCPEKTHLKSTGIEPGACVWPSPRCRPFSERQQCAWLPQGRGREHSWWSRAGSSLEAVLCGVGTQGTGGAGLAPDWGPDGADSFLQNCRVRSHYFEPTLPSCAARKDGLSAQARPLAGRPASTGAPSTARGAPRHTVGNGRPRGGAFVFMG